MSNNIKLNFINRSNDRNKSEIVISQKNEAAGYVELAVAWRVIENCGQGWNHPFIYPMDMSVAVSDSFGNYSQQIPAQDGQLYQVFNNGSGDILQYAKEGASPTEVQNGQYSA